MRPAARQDTGSTRSSDDQPPPLPPKPGKRFGFGLRSVSSALPMTKHSHISPPTSPETANGYPPSPPKRVNKQSRVFGASVGGGGENMETKLATLRDMGFTDEKRNSTILKGTNGNLERAIETLVRLGEDNATISRPRSPAKARPVAVNQPFSSVGVEPPQTTNGITITSTTSREPKIEAALPEVPLDRNENVQNQIQSQSHNPFEAYNTRSDTWPLEKTFENMQVSQPQPLFPNATGGYPIQPNHTEANRFQQSMTPPVPQLHQHLHSNPYAQQMPAINNSFNPFFQPAQQIPAISSGFYTVASQPQPNTNAYNSFVATNASPQSYTNGTTVQSPPDFMAPQIPEQHSMHMVNGSQLLPVHQQQQIDPFSPQQSSSLQPPSQHQQYSYPNQHQPQPLQPQPTGRFDKSSILALYNYPQLAPPPLVDGNVPSENGPPSTNSAAPGVIGAVPKAPGQRSVTMPTQLVSGSRNPFHTATSNKAAVGSNAVPAVPSGLSRHVSQESVDVGGFQNGRHSPDAFASLSARFVR